MGCARKNTLWSNCATHSSMDIIYEEEGICKKETRNYKWMCTCLYSIIGARKLTVKYIIKAYLQFQLFLKTHFLVGFRCMYQKVRLYRKWISAWEHYEYDSLSKIRCIWKRLWITKVRALCNGAWRKEGWGRVGTLIEREMQKEGEQYERVERFRKRKEGTRKRGKVEHDWRKPLHEGGKDAKTYESY